ncbi:MAG: hypothetical protein NZ988_05465 [Thaumarchaeota archaeon]|nr:hypothetical protein [Candidatus Calditenuaceae archaeon]MDW8187472.1 hypothetical protein [Nitrososphaerota archaeon]
MNELEIINEPREVVHSKDPGSTEIARVLLESVAKTLSVVSLDEEVDG